MQEHGLTSFCRSGWNDGPPSSPRDDDLQFDAATPFLGILTHRSDCATQVRAPIATGTISACSVVRPISDSKSATSGLYAPHILLSWRHVRSTIYTMRGRTIFIDLRTYVLQSPHSFYRLIFELVYCDRDEGDVARD